MQFASIEYYYIYEDKICRSYRSQLFASTQHLQLKCGFVSTDTDKGVFRQRVINTINAQVYEQNQCKDAMRCDVTSGCVNLTIHVIQIMRCGVHRLHSFIKRA